MPRKSDSMPINNDKLDRRIKLTDADRVQIRSLYGTGDFSQRKLAEMFGVSRRLIVFTLHPERKVKDLENRAKRGGWKQYYDKEKHRQAVKEHRDYKKNLYEKGLLTNKNN